MTDSLIHMHYFQLPVFMLAYDCEGDFWGNGCGGTKAKANECAFDGLPASARGDRSYHCCFGGYGNCFLVIFRLVARCARSAGMVVGRLAGEEDGAKSFTGIGVGRAEASGLARPFAAADGTRAVFRTGFGENARRGEEFCCCRTAGDGMVGCVERNVVEAGRSLFATGSLPRQTAVSRFGIRNRNVAGRLASL